MRGPRWWYFAVGIWVVAGLVVFLQQWQTGIGLRGEMLALDAIRRERIQLQAENRRLVAAQFAPAELENLRADHAALTQLRGEIEALKKRAPLAVTTPVEAEMLPASAWKNAGRATPEATVATALWAASAGDVEALAATLAFDGAARAHAEALFNALPETSRVQYQTPERLIALFLAKEVPLGAAQAGMAGNVVQPDVATVRLRLQPVEGPAKTVMLNLQRQDDGWKVIVPVTIVDKYGNTLKGPPSGG